MPDRYGRAATTVPSWLVVPDVVVQASTTNITFWWHPVFPYHHLAAYVQLHTGPAELAGSLSSWALEHCFQQPVLSLHLLDSCCFKRPVLRTIQLLYNRTRAGIVEGPTVGKGKRIPRRANDGSRPGLDKNNLGGLLQLAAGMVLPGTQRRARAVLSLSSQERSFQINL